MLRGILLASAGAMALAGTALAQVPPTGGPPPGWPPQRVFTWTGIYAGINGGFTWSGSNSVDTTTTNVFACVSGCSGGVAIGAASAQLATFGLAPSANGFIGGFQAGYNYQFANRLVAGVEVDLQVESGRGSASSFSQAPVAGFPANAVAQLATVTRSVDYLGTVRGRLGYSFRPTLLVYGTAGLAYGGANASTNIVQTLTGPSAGIDTTWGAFGSFANTRAGWTAGGGLEWLFHPRWSLKAEYLYYDLGSVTYRLSPLVNHFTGVPVPGSASFFEGAPVSRARFNGNIARIGVNFRFNWWMPG